MTHADSNADQSRDPLNESASSGASKGLEDTLRWAFELDASPALAGASWLTREIVPHASDAFGGLLDGATTLAQLVELKNAYKMLRKTGTTPAERSLAARLYAVAIGAALVRHGTLITTQRGETLTRALSELHDDETMSASVRDLALQAIDAARTMRES